MKGGLVNHHVFQIIVTLTEALLASFHKILLEKNLAIFVMILQIFRMIYLLIFATSDPFQTNS